MRDVEVDTSGGVWLSSEPEEPRLFRLDFLYLKVEQFYKTELPEILNENPVSWLYNAKCQGCEFTEKCRSEAIGTPGQTPYMTELQAEEMKQNQDIEDVLQHLSLQNTKKSHIELPKPFEIAYEQDRAVFIGKPTVKFSNSPDHNLLMTVQVDPITQRIFAYSTLLFDSTGELVDDFDISSCIQVEETAAMEEFSALMIAFTMDLHRTLSYLEQQKSRAVIFIPSDRERKWVQDVLIRCIAVEKNISTEAQQAAKQVLLTLFNDTQMLLVDSDNIPEMLQQSSAGLKVTIIEEILRENVAIPVPGYYRLQDLSKYLLQKGTTVMMEQDIYAKWESGKDVNPYMETRAKTLLDIIQAFRELANHYAKSSTKSMPLFLLSPDVLQFAPTLTFNSSYLGKLCFFKMLETVTSYDKIAFRAIQRIRRGD
ncbi:hypothetical protein INT43_009006 [Umbelopsis isabellina]|uniref:Uncharacterized protein n=1 Tax=Mortierella isabellina TaxID=91625 RepID=A0A8H7PX42_MORIS|nr:hypothetical protein INT43_009006 [Umbelopsis isabellina]